ncbi:MAG: hypothetical protein WA277_04010 [Nitrospirota bacterium]
MATDNTKAKTIPKPSPSDKEANPNVKPVNTVSNMPLLLLSLSKKTVTRKMERAKKKMLGGCLLMYVTFSVINGSIAIISPDKNAAFFDPNIL